MGNMYDSDIVVVKDESVGLDNGNQGGRSECVEENPAVQVYFNWTWEVVPLALPPQHKLQYSHYSMSTPSGPARPIIIVTGANKYVVFFHPDATCLPIPALTFLRARGGHSGIGFGICHRLLHNVLQNSTTPDDASPLFPRSGAEGEPQGIEYPCAGLTLI